ncbi:glycosyltransferase family 2 protein [Seonamhaeicola sp. ML3]|uniref:glycosyltransferase n=1 Tax=Seonamhaeicola sp. ML3 TaxID=2937786 RepID=UPI00200DC9F7|nr:glycosyltransferase family 2 protein [Seonamhaeicola sp. ML3]
MEYIYLFYQVTQFALLIWLGFCVLYLFVLAVAGLFFRQKNNIKNSRSLPKVALLIPAYKENEVILHTAKEALKQDYHKFDVVVIADSINDEVIFALKSLDITVVEVSFEKSTKAKALNFAMDKLGVNYDLAVVLDADNVMQEGALNAIANKYADGYNAIQAHRTAKNQETGFSMLDAISEEMNNHLFCKGTQAVGLTSRLIGSGMAFDYKMFKRLMKDVDAVGGFDKVLELELVDSGNSIHYLESAHVYDEKVSQSAVFSKQRTRWVSAQFYYLKKYFWGSIGKLLSGKVDYFLKSVQLFLPPRMLFPVMLFVLFAFALIIQDTMFSFIWGISLGLIIFSYSIAIPKKLWTKELLMAIISLPKAVGVMLLAMFKLKGANDKFIHTPHTMKETPINHNN